MTTEFEAGDAFVDMRLGKHVLNWGESTFIPNGINAINPFDVSQLRLPGSELREALLPVSMVSMSVAPTYALSLEAFYSSTGPKPRSILSAVTSQVPTMQDRAQRRQY